MLHYQDPYTKHIYSSDGRDISDIEAYKNTSFMRVYLKDLVLLLKQIPKASWDKGITIHENGVVTYWKEWRDSKTIRKV